VVSALAAAIGCQPGVSAADDGFAVPLAAAIGCLDTSIHMKIRSLDDLIAAKNRGLATLYPRKAKIMVGMASCGIASGSRAVMKALQDEVKRIGFDASISPIGCIGSCYKEPLVDIIRPGQPRLTYANVTPAAAVEIAESLASGRLRKEGLFTRIEEDENLVEGTKVRISSGKTAVSTGEGSASSAEGDSRGTGTGHSSEVNTPAELAGIPVFGDVPFFKQQKRIVLRNCGIINPDSIDEYIARGGYFALHKVLKELSPEQVIEEVKTSGLRGRGGAGFPTGVKWQLTRNATGDVKYVICNADEGDPGAYMDRSVLEGDPHSVLEGMTIGAFAVGAHEGYIYVRAEYPLAIEKLQLAIKQAEEYGLLGEDVLGSGFGFRVSLSKGAGAFVCGEETALMAAIEGRVGDPRPRPPFPAQSGLWGKPTNINNVETWANVPVILARGGNWYSQIGTEKSKGTKVFSLVGKLNNSGLIEVPMGISLRDIVYSIGGGITDGGKLKAVQTGGPSGGFIPESLIDLPVDYERLTEAGAIMGSGGMVIMDDKVCMVDMARFFLTFTAAESCGKCAPCRIGTYVMNETLARICEGQGREGDIEFLEKLAQTVKALSLCGLGQTAPNPVLTTIRYFRHEYEAHIRDKKCPAKVCKRKFTPEEIARLKEEAGEKKEALKKSEAPRSGAPQEGTQKGKVQKQDEPTSRAKPAEEPTAGTERVASRRPPGAQKKADKKDARERKD
jgi:NADH:ubiquinone oxidoreductase subunit F (NADH-binding)/(2Fe-2S) ferredoxin